jgi:hypothetical protein
MLASLAQLFFFACPENHRSEGRPIDRQTSSFMNVASHQQAKNATSSKPKLPNLKKKWAIRKDTRNPGASATRADLIPEARSNVYTTRLLWPAGRP